MKIKPKKMRKKIKKNENISKKKNHKNSMIVILEIFLYINYIRKKSEYQVNR